MREITIIYDGSGYTYAWLKPMQWAKKKFRGYGYHVRYLSLLDYFPFINKLINKERDNKWLNDLLKEKYDIVFLAFHHSKSWLGLCSTEERCDFLKRLRENARFVCWLDTADSTGTCLFDVMPYVDKYMKKQALKDKSLYLNDMYGARIYCDYYHKEIGISDDSLEKIKYPLLDNHYTSKISLSWNLGLCDMYANRLERYLFAYHITSPKWANNTDIRYIDIHYRGSGNGPLIGYQRHYLADFLANQVKWTHPDVRTKIPKSDFLRELRMSQAVLSPFGWGEVCFRDFESFVAGATLLKPTMEHCETWPNVYIPNETYVPIEWDFSNLSQVLEGIGSENYRHIARNGQNLYKQIICSDHSKNIFAEHIIKSVEKL